MKKSKFLILGSIASSSLLMIAASCDVKKKDVETSNSEKQDSKTNSQSNSGNQGSRPDSESNSGNQGSKINSQSNSENQGSRPDSESNSENQDSKTDGSRHESTTPSESTQNDIPTENYKIDDYLNRVKTYGKEANLLITLLAGAWTENYDELQKKYASLWPIVTEFFKLHEKIVSKFDEIKKEIEEFFGKPESKNNKLDNLLKQYEKSRDEIKDAIEVLKRLQKK